MRRGFKKPTVEEVAAHAAQRGLTLDVQHFHDRVRGMTTEEALKFIFEHSDTREQKKAAGRPKRTSLQRTFLTILENRYCHPVRDWSIYDIAKAENLAPDSAKRRYNRHLERLQEIFVSRQQAISGGACDWREVRQRQRPSSHPQTRKTQR